MSFKGWKSSDIPTPNLHGLALAETASQGGPPVVENKKIRNSQKRTVNGICFDSLLEARVYEAFIQAGLVFELKKVFVLLPPFEFNGKQVAPWRHEVDFFLVLHGYQIVVEVKGWPNDVYPYKLKMLRYQFALQAETAAIQSLILFIHTSGEVAPFFLLLSEFARYGSEKTLQTLREAYSHPHSHASRIKKKEKARKYRTLKKTAL